MIIRDFLSRQKGRYLKHLRDEQVEGLRDYFSDSPSIITNNCLSGFLCQDLKLPYLSPTVGLYFFFPDYIEFLSDIKGNLAGGLQFVKDSKYPIGNDRIRKHKKSYPIAMLNEKIEIHFLHYETEKDAESKWIRRSERINFENLIILGTELDLCSQTDIQDFNNLNFSKKHFFTRNEYNLASTIYIEKFKNNLKIGDPYQSGHVLYKHLARNI